MRHPGDSLEGAKIARDRGEPAKFWKTIVFRDMVTKVMTICSAAIRVLEGLHISLVAAAVAALMLETTGTKFRDIVAVSIQRASGSSPYTILPASLRVARLGVFDVVHTSIIILGTIILVVSTFTSTILLTDLKNVDIAGPMQTKLLPIGLGPNTTLSANGVLHYRSSPSANWRFGEMKPGNVVSTAEIADTGNTYRDLLPYMRRGPEQRWSTTPGQGWWVTLEQSVSVLALKGFASVSLQADRAFSQSSISDQRKMAQTWDLGLEDPLSGRSFTFIPLMLLKSSLILLRGFGHLHLGGGTDESEAMDKIDQLKESKTNMDARWTTALLKNGTEVFSATLYFVADNAPELYEITMTGMTVQSEPTVEWQRNDTSKSSEQLQKQLGIGVSHNKYSN
ncbi:hypothetical protein FACUT_7093 [Fusarium acutatum]|uniref:Uncharacterized protein n=1 Tax=Fusarium acutatum TaxID=78861 RepID=A0A8H4JMR2_9HYPO|nr:hypothetical protein FACUT_7093 [Fusarium acutatum]